jgi:hypothetical protein
MTLRVEMSGTQAVTYTQTWDAENRLGHQRVLVGAGLRLLSGLLCMVWG